MEEMAHGKEVKAGNYHKKRILIERPVFFTFYYIMYWGYNYVYEKVPNEELLESVGIFKIGKWVVTSVSRFEDFSVHIYFSIFDI